MYILESSRVGRLHIVTPGPRSDDDACPQIVNGLGPDDDTSFFGTNDTEFFGTNDTDFFSVQTIQNFFWVQTIRNFWYQKVFCEGATPFYFERF